MDLASLPDEELLYQFSTTQAPRLFTELVRRHHHYVTKECNRHLRNRTDAQDVAQEVFIRLLTKSHTYNAERPFMPWLGRIIHNRCTDHLKQDKGALYQEVSIKIASTLEDEIDTEVIGRPTVDILEELLAKLSGEDKLILLLKYEQRWSIRAIHESLNLSEDVVKQRLKRSREKLQKLFDRYPASN